MSRPRKTPPPDMTYRIACEAPDHFGCVVFEGDTLEEAKQKLAEANRAREAAGKQPFTVLPYAVISL